MHNFSPFHTSRENDITGLEDWLFLFWTNNWTRKPVHFVEKMDNLIYNLICDDLEDEVVKFGDKLSLYLKQRNMKIVELSRFVDMDRSNLYKIVKGTRKLPDKSYIQSIAETLCLTEEEFVELNQAYDIDEVGSYVYYRRKKVEEILKLSVSWDIDSSISMGNNDYDIDIHDYQYCSGKHTINSIVSKVMMIETKKEHPHIKIFNQVKNDYIMNMIQFLGNINSDIEITHLFGMNNSLNQNENEYYNLDYLISIFPILSSNLQYHPYYYRTHIPYTNDYSFFSNVVITSDYVFTFTNDYQDALIYTNKSIMDVYNNMFQKYLKKSLIPWITLNIVRSSSIDKN